MPRFVLFALAVGGLFAGVRAEDDIDEDDLDVDLDVDSEDSEFQDTPLLSSLWEATSTANNDAIDRLLDSSPTAISHRAGDGRGLAWWAWEFQNTHVLASILSLGGDPLADVKDKGGETAKDMCKTDCDEEELMTKARSMVDDLKAKKEAREKEKENNDIDADLDDDEDLSDDEF